MGSPRAQQDGPGAHLDAEQLVGLAAQVPPAVEAWLAAGLNYTCGDAAPDAAAALPVRAPTAQLEFLRVAATADMPDPDREVVAWPSLASFFARFLKAPGTDTLP